MYIFLRTDGAVRCPCISRGIPLTRLTMREDAVDYGAAAGERAVAASAAAVRGVAAAQGAAISVQVLERITFVQEISQQHIFSCYTYLHNLVL